MGARSVLVGSAVVTGILLSLARADAGQLPQIRVQAPVADTTSEGGDPARADTVRYQIVGHHMETMRVAEVVLGYSIEDLEFDEWSDGDLFRPGLRIGPWVNEEEGTILVAVAVKHPLESDSGLIGTIKFLREEAGRGGVSLRSATVVDKNFKEIPATPRGSGPVGQSLGVAPAPPAFRLAATAPNPVAQRVSIAFEVPGPGGRVEVKIYDVRGREVRTLVDRWVSAGRYSEDWDLRNNQGQKIAPGVYFCRMESGKFARTRKMVVMR